MSYCCLICDEELQRCGLCPRWLHKREIAGTCNGEPMCATCKIICDHYPDKLPVIQVKQC